MHERSIIRQLLVQVEKLMDDHQATHISAIHISVGEFSGVEPLLLNSAYDDAVEDSKFCGATLEVETVPLEGQCVLCGKEFLVEQFRFECPACEAREITILRGEDLMLESVTMEGSKV